MNTFRGIGVAMVAAAIAAGCSGTAAPASPTQGAATTQPSAAPTAPPTATPEPTFDLAPVAAAYLAMSNALIASNQGAVAGLNIATSDAEASAAYQVFVDGDDVALAAVKAIKFPPDLQDEATAFIAALEKHRAAMAKLAADPQDADPTIDQMLNEAAAESRAAATAIRAALGLPPPATQAPQPS